MLLRTAILAASSPAGAWLIPRPGFFACFLLTSQCSQDRRPRFFFFRLAAWGAGRPSQFLYLTRGQFFSQVGGYACSNGGFALKMQQRASARRKHAKNFFWCCNIFPRHRGSPPRPRLLPHRHDLAPLGVAGNFAQKFTGYFGGPLEGVVAQMAISPGHRRAFMSEELLQRQQVHPAT